jgi:hypothetical protein
VQVGEREVREIVAGKVAAGAPGRDRLERVGEASGQPELRALASDDRCGGMAEQSGGGRPEARLGEQPVDRLRFSTGEREARTPDGRRSRPLRRPRPRVRQHLWALIVAQRGDVEGPGTEMAVASEEGRALHASCRHLREVGRELRRDRAQRAVELLTALLRERASSHRGPEERRRQKGVTRDDGERKRTACPALGEKPETWPERGPGVRELVAWRPVDPPLGFEQAPVEGSTASERLVRQATERGRPALEPGRRQQVAVTAPVRREEVEIEGGLRDLELDAVVQLGMGVETVQPGVDECRLQIRRQARRQERVKARADVHVGPPEEKTHQRHARKTAVAHRGARPPPHLVTDEEAEERDRERRRNRTDQLGGVPVRHLPEDAAPAGEAGLRAFVARDDPSYRRDRRCALRPGRHRRDPRGDRTHLQHEHRAADGFRELDLEETRSALRLDLPHGGEDPEQPRRADHRERRAMVDPERLRVTTTRGDDVGLRRAVVILDDVIRRVGLGIARQDDPARAHRGSHLLDEDLIAFRAVVRRHHVSDRRRDRFPRVRDVEAARVSPGERATDAVLAARRASHRETRRPELRGDSPQDGSGLAQPVGDREVHELGDGRATEPAVEERERLRLRAEGSSDRRSAGARDVTRSRGAHLGAPGASAELASPSRSDSVCRQRRHSTVLKTSESSRRSLEPRW